MAAAGRFSGQCCNFSEPVTKRGRDGQSTLSGDEVKELVDESILPPHILTAHSPDLTFSQDVDCFVTLDGPSCRLEIAESLLGVHAPLDG